MTHARRWTCVVIVGQGIFGKGSRVAISASGMPPVSADHCLRRHSLSVTHRQLRSEAQ